jgi:hypothetical protein
MTLEGAIKIYTDNAEYERVHGNLQGCMEFRQLAEWLKCLAKISDMLDGTIDHLSGDDAKELLSDVKWELKLAKLTEL